MEGGIKMDIALVLDRIRPNAKWRMSGTYEQLASTWEDEEQVLPTQEELQTAWLEILSEQKIIELDNKYKPIFANLSDTFLLAQQRDDLALQEEIKAERKLAEENYAKEREVIINGTGN